MPATFIIWMLGTSILNRKNDEKKTTVQSGSEKVEITYQFDPTVGQAMLDLLAENKITIEGWETES